MRVLISALAVLAIGCQETERPSTKGDVVAPFSIAEVGGENNSFLLLNSGAYGEYDSGSIVEFAVDSTGKVAKEGWSRTGLLGTRIKVNEASSLVASASVGSDGRIEIFNRQAAGKLEKLASISIGNVLSVLTLNWFQLSAVDYLYAEVTAVSGLRHVYIWRVTDGVERELALPDDFELAGSENRLSFSSPAYLPDQKLFVAFPDESKTLLWGFPPLAFEYLKTALSGVPGDARKVSVLALDAENFLVNHASLESSYALVPSIYSENGFGGEIHQDVIDGSNLMLKYRRSFGLSFVPRGGKCDSDYSDALLMVDETGSVDVAGRGGVFKASGWSNLKQFHSAAFAASNLNDKVVRGSVVFSPYSTSWVSSKLGSAGSRIVSMATYSSPTLCRPIWNRIENRLTTQGKSKAWVQWNDDTSPRWPTSALLPDRGVASLSVVGGFVVTASYSYNKLNTFTMEELAARATSDKLD